MRRETGIPSCCSREECPETRRWNTTWQGHDTSVKDLLSYASPNNQWPRAGTSVITTLRDGNDQCQSKRPGFCLSYLLLIRSPKQSWAPPSVITTPLFFFFFPLLRPIHSLVPISGCHGQSPAGVQPVSLNLPRGFC